METQQKSHYTEIDLDEKVLIPSSTIIFLNRVYELSKCHFMLERHHVVFALNIPILDKKGTEIIQKVQMKIHFKHISKVEVLPSTMYDGATCISMLVSDFAASRFTETLKRLRNVTNGSKSSTLMGPPSLENRITCDMFLHWTVHEREIQKILYYMSAASYVLKFPNQSNVVPINEIRSHMICFMENDVFLRIVSAAKVTVSVVNADNNAKFLVFNNHHKDHPPEEDEIVLSDTDEDKFGVVTLSNGMVYRNGDYELQVQFLGQRHTFPYSRLCAIARGEWLSGDDVDYFLNYHYTMLFTEHVRRKIWIKPIKFFLDINAKKSVEKKDQAAMEDLRNIITADSSLKSLKDAGKEFERPFVIIPVIYKDHWFVAVIVNPAAAIHEINEIKNERKTMILIMDSLKDSRALSVDDRDGIFNLLTMYLYFAKEKLAHNLNDNKRFNRALVQKVMVQVPQQTNAVDCGVYLIKYVEQFFKKLPDPENMPNDWTHDPPEMFKDFECSQGRKELIDIVCRHSVVQETSESLRKKLFEMYDSRRMK